MQVVSHSQLIRNRARLGAAFQWAAFGVLAVGLFLSWRSDPTTTDFGVEYTVALLLGMVFYLVGQPLVRRWAPLNRRSPQLSHALRTLDERYKLYVALAANLPDYVVVGPAGVQVLELRDHGGKIVCQRDTWQRSGSGGILGRLGRVLGPGLGNPTRDAQDDLRKLKEMLAREGLEDVPLSALVVFVHPKAQLQVEGCSVAVTTLKELKDVLRRAAGKGQSVALNAARIREVQRVLDQRLQTGSHWR